jgi:type IV pilus assembly protein PilA
VHHRLPSPARDERGFTLMELMIVILVIGVLAAIAIPMFLGKREAAYDADAKSNARTLMSYMDGCFVPNEDFTKCSTRADAEADDLDWGGNPGQVRVTDTTKDSYVIEAISKATSNGENNVFRIERSIRSAPRLSCTGRGGCHDGEW